MNVTKTACISALSVIVLVSALFLQSDSEDARPEYDPTTKLADRGAKFPLATLIASTIIPYLPEDRYWRICIFLAFIALFWGSQAFIFYWCQLGVARDEKQRRIALEKEEKDLKAEFKAGIVTQAAYDEQMVVITEKRRLMKLDDLAHE